MNILTALGIMEMANKRKPDAVIITGAATKMGKTLALLALKQKIKPILIVRSCSCKSFYEKQGIKCVLNSKDSDFESKL